MTETAETVVRKFFAAWAAPDPDLLASFFAPDAAWVDGPQGVREGVDAITTELAAQLGATGGAVVDIRSLVANRRTVMVEEVSCFTIAGTPVSAVVMAVFELDADGRIKQWREAYDLTSLTDKIEAATRRSNACGG